MRPFLITLLAGLIWAIPVKAATFHVGSYGPDGGVSEVTIAGPEILSPIEVTLRGLVTLYPPPNLEFPGAYGAEFFAQIFFLDSFGSVIGSGPSFVWCSGVNIPGLTCVGGATFSISESQRHWRISVLGHPINSGTLEISATLPDNFRVAPIPAALPLLASGLGALGFVGWRRRRKTTQLKPSP